MLGSLIVKALITYLVPICSTSSGPNPAWTAVPSRQQQGSGSQVMRVLRSAKLHRRPRLLTTLFLWMFGLYAMFLSPAPVTITDEKMQRFEDRLQILAKTDKPRQAAEQRWLQAEMDVGNSKVGADPMPVSTCISQQILNCPRLPSFYLFSLPHRPCVTRQYLHISRID